MRTNFKFQERNLVDESYSQSLTSSVDLGDGFIRCYESPSNVRVITHPTENDRNCYVKIYRISRNDGKREGGIITVNSLATSDGRYFYHRISDMGQTRVYDTDASFRKAIKNIEVQLNKSNLEMADLIRIRNIGWDNDYGTWRSEPSGRLYSDIIPLLFMEDLFLGVSLQQQ